MGEGELEVLAGVAPYGIQAGVVHLPRKQVQKPVLALEVLPVQADGKAGVQVGVVPHPLFHELHVEGILAEDFLVRDELKVGPVPLLLLERARLLGCQHAFLEDGLGALAVADGNDAEVG